MDKVEIKEYQNLSEPVRVTVVTGLLNMEGVRVPAGGKEGQNLTKKSDKDYDVYWADPDDINSIEHITLNGEEVPVENKTAKITVDKSTVGLDNVDNTADVNKPVSKLQQNALSRLNEAIAKNPEKLYLTWKGYNFPYSSDTRFTMPAGSYIDWGDGVIDAFTTIQQSDSTDTQVSFGVLNKPDNVSKLNHGINDVDYIRKENVTCVILNNENDVITLKSVHDITSFDYVDITLQVCDESDSENEYSIYSGDIEFNQTIDGKTPRGSHWETIRLSIDQLRQGGSYITDETITSAWKACQQFKTYYEQDNALFLNFGTHFKGQEVWVYIADIRWGIVVPSAVRKVAAENTSTVATHMYTGDDFILTHLISIYGLSQIPEDGFIHASYLIDIRFPTNTVDINYRAFCLCQKLTRIELPHTRNIGEAAFLNSNFIKYVRLGQWVKSIGDSAFSGCDQIEKFYIDADTPPTLGKNAFYYTSDQLKIIVPKSSVDAYKNAAGWSEYADKIVYEVDSSDLDKAITDLDVDNIAYKNKNNTFTVFQEFNDRIILPGSNSKYRNYVVTFHNADSRSNIGEPYIDIFTADHSTEIPTLDHTQVLYPKKSGTLALIEDIPVLNIENGEGKDSIQSKYTGEIDDTHFKNTNTGESAAVIGEANLNAGNRATVSGKMNRSSAPNSLIVGLGNGRGIGATPTLDVISGEQLFVFGALNSVLNGNGNAVLGAENTLSDVRYSTIIGRGNIINNTSLYEGKCVVGRFNNQKPDTMFEVGVGDYNNRVNGFEVYKDGRAKVQTAPKDNTDVVRKLELDTKYDKAGGTIGGNVVITGDLTVNGTQHINNTENLNVENAMIYSNANGATLATNGGIGIKKNATDVYGIVYDPTSDSVKLGIGKSDANGRFTFNANEGQPVAIRDDSAQLTNNHIIKWDSTNHKLVDSGKSVDDFVNLTDNQTISGIKTFSNAANFKDAISVDGLVTAKAGITTTKIESTTGVGSYDVRSGQFTNGSAENVIKLPQKAGTIALDGDLVATPITETETVIVDTTTVNFALDAEHDTGMYVSAENAISLSSTQLQWNDGRQKYKVIWDGVEYICYVQSTTNPKYKEDGTYTYYDWQILGNGNNKLNCYNKDTNIYPFAITQDRWKNSAEWLIYATTSTAATHTIKVVKIEGTYKKVTPEYQYDYLSMLKNGRSNDTLIHGFSVDDDGMSSGILSGNGNQYINDVPVGDKYDTGVVIFGNGNLVHRYKATGNVLGVTITGYGNALHLKGADCLSPFITGYKNTITANKGSIHPDAVFGSHNKLTYDGNTTYGLNLVGGNSHTIKNAALSLITGLGNTVECLTANDYIYSNIVGGQQNTVNHDRVIVGGRGNTSDRNNQFIAGTYSAANEKAIVKIGNGTKDAHANAFEVLDDNRAKVFGTPTENNDVLRYQDTAVEVETSLMGA